MYFLNTFFLTKTFEILKSELNMINHFIQIGALETEEIFIA